MPSFPDAGVFPSTGTLPATAVDNSTSRGGLSLLLRASATTAAAGSAAFPSRLRASGRQLVNEVDAVMPVMKGFNAQVVPWPLTDFQAMKAAGAAIVRQVIFWDLFQPSAPAPGVGINGTGITQSVVDALDTQIARTEAAGMYSLFSFHLNVSRTPTWAFGAGNETQQYAAYGQTLTQFLADRYGNPLSAKYTKSVIGFGLNEPLAISSTDPNPGLETIQANMISWFRASAPAWIGFVTYAYASSTPIYDRTWQDPAATNANPDAYDAVGGNVVIDFHDYFWGVAVGSTPTNGVPYTSPLAEMRLFNGLPHNEVYAGFGTTYTTNATVIAQHTLYLKPYKQFSINADAPLMLGEWGWVPANTGYSDYVTDAKNVWADVGMVIQMEWDFDVTLSQEPFAAYPNRVWQPWTTAWLATGTPPPPPPPPPEDKALFQTASASSIFGAGYEAFNAIDGNSTSRWSSTATDNQWWQVDLGTARQVDTVSINWEPAYASQYLIQTSTDGTTFTTVATVNLAAVAVKSTSFTAVSARYVRITGVTRATVFGISFWDVNVYGPADVVTPPPPPTAQDVMDLLLPLGVTVNAVFPYGVTSVQLAGLNVDAQAVYGVTVDPLMTVGLTLGA